MPQAAFEIDPDLTAIAIAFKNPEQNYIADKVMPYVDVNSADFKYDVYPTEQGFTVPETRVGRKSAPNTIEISSESRSASVEDYALDAPIPNADIAKSANSPKKNIKGRTTENLTNLVLLDREMRVAKQARNLANYGHKITLGSGSTFDDPNSDPIKILLKAREQMLVDPNKLVIGNDVWLYLRQHPKLVKAVNKNSGDSGVISRDDFARLLEVSEVIVGNTRYNRARKGQSAILEPCWKGICSLMYIDQNADTSQGITWGMTARFGDRFSGTYFDAKMGARGGEVIRAGESVKELAIAPDCGYFIENALSASAA